MLRSLLATLACLLLLTATIDPAGAQNRAAEQERLLSKEQKKAIQEALIWTGHYDARVDGDFGPGTRRAITRFQDEEGYRPTGYLRQRHIDRLMQRRAQKTEGYGWEIRRFPDLGMSLGIPTALFGKAEPSEIGLRFRSKDGKPKSELILYSAVPMSDARFDILREEVVDRRVFKRDTYDAGDENWFVFSGKSDKGVEQYTYVVNRNDGVRGFSFRYLERDSKGLDLLNVAMYNSLETFRAENRPDPVAEADPPEPTQPKRSGLLFDDNDLAALESGENDAPAPRRERRSTGFLVTSDGTILTTASAVDGCQAVSVNDRVDASIKAIDRDIDLAILAIPPQGKDLPHLQFRSIPVPKGQEFRALVQTQRDLQIEEGKVESLKSPTGKVGIYRVSTELRRGSRGAPLLDLRDRVIGVVIGRRMPRTASDADDNTRLPRDERLAVSGLIAQAFLEANGVDYTVTPRTVDKIANVSPAARLATVRLECSK